VNTLWRVYTWLYCNVQYARNQAAYTRRIRQLEADRRILGKQNSEFNRNYDRQRYDD
jgi:hypothetical protein